MNLQYVLIVPSFCSKLFFFPQAFCFLFFAYPSGTESTPFDLLWGVWSPSAGVFMYNLEHFFSSKVVCKESECLWGGLFSSLTKMMEQSVRVVIASRKLRKIHCSLNNQSCHKAVLLMSLNDFLVEWNMIENMYNSFFYSFRS